MSLWSPKDENLAFQLVEVIRFFNHKNWSPATSTNYSVRLQNPEEIMISRSGVDKAYFSFDDLIKINLKGDIHPDFHKAGIKSSAETEIHTYLYNKFADVGCVLHTHSLMGTVLSQKHLKKQKIEFKNLEIIKGLEGNATHEMTELLPIVPNSQTMKDILKQMDPWWNQSIHGFLIAGHGLYTWGKDLTTAKRHVETFEFLLETYAYLEE